MLRPCLASAMMCNLVERGGGVRGDARRCLGLVKWGVPDTVPGMAMEGGWARYDGSGAARGTERDEVGEVGVPSVLGVG